MSPYTPRSEVERLIRPAAPWLSFITEQYFIPLSAKTDHLSRSAIERLSVLCTQTPRDHIDLTEWAKRKLYAHLVWKNPDLADDLDPSDYDLRFAVRERKYKSEILTSIEEDKTNILGKNYTSTPEDEKRAILLAFLKLYNEAITDENFDLYKHASKDLLVSFLIVQYAENLKNPSYNPLWNNEKERQKTPIEIAQECINWRDKHPRSM